MVPYRIAVIVGSLRADSFNRKLATAIAKFAPSEFVFKQLQIGLLPLYNQDEDDHQANSVLRFKKDIGDSQGLLFVTPEYNRSIPGVLKNALDHGSRPHGKNAWDKKPAGILGVSPGPIGTALAQQHLRNVLSCLNVPVLCQPEAFLHAKEGFFDNSGNIGEGSQNFLQSWMDKYVSWIKQHTPS